MLPENLTQQQLAGDENRHFGADHLNDNQNGRSTRKQVTPNIAHILPWPSIGGTEHAALRLAQAVAGRYKSKIFYLNGAAPVRDMFAHAGFETIAYDPITPSYRHLKKFMRDSYALAQEFRRREIDI